MLKKAIGLVLSLICCVTIAYYFMDFSLTGMQWEAFKATLITCLFSAALCYIVSTLTGNYSQVDKLWSIMPMIYALTTAYFSGYEPRIVLMLILICAWGIRLTYNFSRRNGYSWKFWGGEEDYRWAILRKKPPFDKRWIWNIFNFGFISFYQMLLIWLFTLPVIFSMEGAQLNIWDYLLALAFILMLIIETVADQQQWNFHRKKAVKGYEGPGFLNKGLWSYVRHPNYSAEQAMWLIIYLFSLSAGNQIINLSILGIILLFVLFKNSTDFSEEISASKYMEYEEYIKDVPRFIPDFFQLKKRK